MRTNSLLVFPFLLIILLLSCSPSKRLATPALELKNRKDQVLPADTLISGILGRYLPDSLVGQNRKYHIKLIYTQIDRKAGGKPVFTHHYFHVLPDEYFYPASTVKMPVSFLALQRLNELNIKGLDKYSTLITESGYSGQSAIYNDPTTEDGRPTVAHYIKKIFLASDNEAFNRLYEFLGQEYINNSLHKMGYDSAQIIHRLNISLTEDQNRHTNPVKFYAAPGKKHGDSSLQLVYQQPLAGSNLEYEKRKTLLGDGYYSGNQLIRQPFDFSKKNRLNLVDLHSILLSVLFPKAVPKAQRFKLKKEDYRLLYTCLSMKPGESRFPEYDSSYSDAYVKLLLYGGKGKMDEEVRIFNKEGDAYGFLTDVAYIVDFKNQVEFLLSASIYCNSDGIFNDDHYDYETIGYPFMKNLGRAFYNYELQRTRKHRPDLSRFKMSY